MEQTNLNELNLSQLENENGFLKAKNADIQEIIIKLDSERAMNLEEIKHQSIVINQLRASLQKAEGMLQNHRRIDSQQML